MSSNVEGATNLIQFVGAQVAGQSGGPMGEAAASMLLREGGLLTSTVGLLDKIDAKLPTTLKVKK